MEQERHDDSTQLADGGLPTVRGGGVRRRPGTLTRREALESVGFSPADTYPWPCDRRDAHGRHGDCPGVQAHPNTMIGTP